MRPSLQQWRGRQTFAEIRARFFCGLRWGGAVWMLLVPVFFCPWPKSRHSLYDRLGHADLIIPFSAGVVLGMGLAFALTARAKLRDAPDLASFFPPPDSGGDFGDRAKTHCLGILLPLAANAYAIYQFTHPRRGDYLFRRPMNPDTIVAFGIVGLGIALFLHGIGFVPYERVPFLKYVLAAAGVTLFVYGLSWPLAVR